MRKITTHLVKNFDIAINGNLYGGRMLDWIDEAGSMYVHSLVDAMFVTLKIGETIFHKPVKVGSLVSFFCKNLCIREHSLSFDIMVQDVRTGDVVLTTSMVFVCVDSDGKKDKISNYVYHKFNE